MAISPHDRGVLAMTQGKVKWFNEAKGYGFIEQNEGPDIFVHHTSIKAEGFRSLMVGEEVFFDIYEGQKGLIAKNVVQLHSGLTRSGQLKMSQPRQ